MCEFTKTGIILNIYFQRRKPGTRITTSCTDSDMYAAGVLEENDVQVLEMTRKKNSIENYGTVCSILEKAQHCMSLGILYQAF